MERWSHFLFFIEMFQGMYANNLAPGQHTTSLLGLRKQPLPSPVHGVTPTPCRNGQLRFVPQQTTEISPQDWEEHIFFTLAHHFIFFLILCICQVELRAAEMDAHMYRCTSTGVSRIAGYGGRGTKMVVKQDF